MSDTDEIPLDDASAIGAPPKIPNDRLIDSGEMGAALDYANKMKGEGVSDEDVEKFLGAEMADKPPGPPSTKKEEPQEISLDQAGPVVDFGDVKGGVTTSAPSNTFLGQADASLRNLLGPGTYFHDVGERVIQYGKDISNIAGEVASYVKNYGPEHETREPGPVTAEDQKAAKLMGIPQFDVGQGGFHGKVNPETGEVEAHHPTIYKMTPQEIQNLNDRTLKSWGLDPEEERKRGSAFAEARFAEDADPVANITANNAVGIWLQDKMNPHMAASKQYAAIQNVVQAQRIMKTPLMHSQQEVDAAMELLYYYKSTVGKGVVETTKDLLEEIKENPGTKIAQIAASLEADPELLKLGELRLGAILNDAKVATLTADMQRAQQAAETARRLQAATPESVRKASRAAFIEKAEGKAAELGEELKGIKKKAILQNIASEPVIGGLANVALDEQAQMKEKGYVTKGSEVTPLVHGAALGTVAAAGEALKLLPTKAKAGEIPIHEVTPPEPEAGARGVPPGEPPPPAGPGGAGETTKPGAPGEPLPPETPVSKNKNVPLYGGVDASGKLVHLNEGAPAEIPMKNTKGETVNVPVDKMVAWHERVEFPLMHLTGPMNSAAILDLLKRVQGEGTIAPEVIAKLKKGESLSYDEAHEIATMAENARVRTLYGVDPKIYQEALAPHVRAAAEKAKAPEAKAPETIDKKPYEETGKTEDLKGAGATPEETGKGPETLPPALSKASPRYGFGKNLFKLAFDSDIDKAAYIAAQTKKSAKDAAFVDFVKKATGLTEEAIRAHGAKVKAFIKDLASKGKGGDTLKIPKQLAAVGGLAAGGAAAGAYFGDKDRKEGAQLGMFPPLLTRIFTHGEKVAKGGDVGMLREARLAKQLGSPARLMAEQKLNALEKAGLSPTAIWLKHGFYKDAEGNWLREISDENLSLKHKFTEQTAPTGSMPLRDFANHPELEQQYPELWKDLRIDFAKWDSPKTSAWYDPSDNSITIHPDASPDILAHELQHAVQEYEGLPRGASPSYIYDDLKMERTTVAQNLNMLWQAAENYKKAGKPIPKDLQTRYMLAFQKFQKFPADVQGLKKLAFQKYLDVIGEVQSRTVQERLKYTPEQRQATYPGDQITALKDQWDYYTAGEVMRSEKEPGADIPETNKMPNEEDHLKAAAAGDQKSIGALYNHYVPRLTRVMDRYLRVAGPILGISGEDMAQKVFFKAMQALPDFRKESSFYTWLYAIGKNEALNAIVASKREVPTESMFKAGEANGGKPGALTGQVGFGGAADEIGSDPIKQSVQGAAATEDSPEVQNAGRQISQLVRQTIATLPKNVADVLRLYEIEGMTDLEVARELHMNPATVRKIASRGREYLAKAFQGTETEKLFKQQGGFADPELLKRLAKFTVLAGGGAAFGANYFDPQHPYKSMVQGATLGLMAGQVKWGNVFKKFKDSFKYDPTVNIHEQLNQYDWDLARGERLKAKAIYAIDGLVKTAESRVKIARWLDGDRTLPLTPEEQRAATIARDVYDKAGQQALQAGVLQDFLENYVNHEWKPTAKRDQLIQEMRDALRKQPNMSPKDRHALTRKFTSLEEGKAAGLEPVSEDVNVLMSTYLDSITRAMANKKLLEALKAAEDENGKKLVQQAGKAPYSYVPINHSQLAPYRVHPSIAPSLDFLYHSHGGGAIVQGIEGLNTALKRWQVSLSLFHAKALLDAFAGAGEFTHPWRNFVDAAMSSAGKSRGHEAYLKGDIGDDIDHLIRSLRITPRKGNVPVEDVTSGFYEGLKKIQDSMDAAIKYSGTATFGSILAVSKALDHLLWENLHSGLKLVVGMNSLERLRRSYAKDFAKDPNAEVPSTAELADRAGSYTNDVFGGLNWRRLADDANTRWGHELGKMLANPAGRRVAQVMLFAPDWTYSTVRSVAKALGPGSGIKGLLNPKQVADLHRMYLIRSAMIYATLYNGINMALSGHPIWENERNGKPEPFLVDLGNGEWAQANKHAMEVPNMVTHPAKWLLGKLGNIPAEVMEQFLGKEYLNPDYMPPMKEGRLAHAAKRFLPFIGTSLLEQGPKEAISSALGVPIYGHPKTSKETPSMKEKDWEKIEAERERRRAKREKRTELLLKGE